MSNNFELLQLATLLLSQDGPIKDRLFEGDPVALVSHLLQEHAVDAREIEELKALIEEHEKKESR